MLDLTAGRLVEAIHHARRAPKSIKACLEELHAGLAGTLAPLPEPSTSATDDAKGKGKQGALVLAPDGQVQNWSKTQIKADIEELGELKQDLALKARPPLSTYSAVPYLLTDAS